MTVTRENPLRTVASRPSRSISSLGYVPGLDGMRALAVVAVMVYHANSDWLPGGFIGVEVFFVISGYLITLLLIGEHERTGGIDLRAFWLRRARRLLPALFIMMGLLTAFAAIFKRHELGQLRGDVLAGTGYVSNWYQLWVGQGYTATGEWAPLRHLWSLAVEEQFYLVWPLVMAGLLGLGRRRLPEISRWLLLTALVVAVAVALLYYPGHDLTAPSASWTIGGHPFAKIDTLYLSTITRGSGLLIGAAFAMLWRPSAVMRGPLRTKGRLLDVVGTVGLVALVFMALSLHLVTPAGADPWLFRGGFIAVDLATIMVIAAVTHRGSHVGRLLGTPTLAYVGTRSYGLYLFHWPIYEIIRGVAGNHMSVAEFATAMVLTVVITEASYRFVETPIRHQQVGATLGRLRDVTSHETRRLVAIGAVGVVALVGFAGVSLATASLRPSDFAASQAAGEQAVTDIAAAPTTPATVAPTAPSTSVASATTVAGAVAAPTTAVAPVTTPATTVAPAVAPTTAASGSPLPLFAVGDSVMLGAAPALTDAGFVVDAHQNRQLADYLPVIQQLAASGRLTGTVVVHLGTNGGFTSDQLDAFMEALAGVPQVLVLTDHAQRSWIAGNNQHIAALQGTYPNVLVGNWDALAADCPGSCFYDDGIHLRPDGQSYYTALIQSWSGLT